MLGGGEGVRDDLAVNSPLQHPIQASRNIANYQERKREKFRSGGPHGLNSDSTQNIVITIAERSELPVVCDAWMYQWSRQLCVRASGDKLVHEVCVDGGNGRRELQTFRASALHQSDEGLTLETQLLPLLQRPLSSSTLS